MKRMNGAPMAMLRVTFLALTGVLVAACAAETAPEPAPPLPQENKQGEIHPACIWHYGTCWECGPNYTHCVPVMVMVNEKPVPVSAQ